MTHRSNRDYFIRFSEMKIQTTDQSRDFNLPTILLRFSFSTNEIRSMKVFVGFKETDAQNY